MLEQWQERARALKREIRALYYAARDSRTPWYAKLWIVVIVAYALSPIDLIPDFIPLLGYLDDLLLLPLGIYVALRLIPAPVMADARARAASIDAALPRSWRAATVIILVWIAGGLVLGYWLWPELAAPAMFAY